MTVCTVFIHVTIFTIVNHREDSPKRRETGYFTSEVFFAETFRSFVP